MLPALEALLFAAPQPLTLEALAEALAPLAAPEVGGLLEQLRAELEGAGRGVTLVQVAGGWQIVSRPEYAPYVQRMLRGRRKARLSRAALETLAIVAYRQPVTKADIEGIRGVDSSGVLAHLLERNLVGIRGRAHTVGRPLLYGTTQEFLVYFGINDLTDLPKPEELAELLKDREGLEAGLFDGLEAEAAADTPGTSAASGPPSSGDAEGMTAAELDELEAAWEEPSGAPGGGSDGDKAR
ncbi:MAG: SMC-Scp complex subunit ScpB [Candidatus Eisenbacteria bacterium]|nr:SMC-Scp complex subunit ScpB [Candidatus Eisenbacteria bacterium]